MKTKDLLIGGSLLTLGAAFILKSIKAHSKKVVAVKPFKLDKYLGKWYEIARFDYRFENNLDNTTAEYSLNDDGSVKVVNRGYNYKKDEYEEATGKAVFVEAEDEAKLKVSFWGPFYSAYNVIAIDPKYKYAMVTGDDLKHLWILSRKTSIPEDIKLSFLQQVLALGYDVSQLVWVEHNGKSKK